MSIFSTGPNGEGIINSTPCAVTIGNEARRCRSSIYNCSTKQVLLILANIVDLNSDSIGILNEKTILGLASISGSLIRERNEVAAFVYVSTTSVSQASAAGFCFSSFDVLHLAIAESRLSNRAWQVLERSLLPLPYEQWDACEKLRRSVLQFSTANRWPLTGLWEYVHVQMRNNAAQERARLERELAAIHGHMDAAYTDKLDGKISPEFWQRKQADWQTEEFRIKSLISRLDEDKSGEQLLSVQRILELAQKAYFLYLTRKPLEQAELLRKVLLNCSIDAVSLYPTYRKPFDMIYRRAKNHEWSGREDLNLRPPGPEPDSTTC